MKDRKTQRAVKNILHNELGITSEKVETLITDYIDEKFDRKVDQFLSSRQFENMVNTRIKEAIAPTVREFVSRKMAGTVINVTVKE